LLENKVKETKNRVQELEKENDCLQAELEKLKNGEMLDQHQKIDSLLG
jgi:peptidoglycan hydrolase CwlO-like protein